MKQSDITFLIAFILLFTGCVRDGENLECETSLRFIYEYNMSYVDLFAKQASKIDLYIFDENGYLHSEFTDKTDGYFPEDYHVTLNLEEGNYTLIAWSGLYEDHYTRSLTTKESTHFQDLSIQVNCDPGIHLIDYQLPPLWYGKTENKVYTNTQDTISLIKNTNIFRIVMKNMDDDGNDINVDSFDIIIKSNNGAYDHENNPSGDTYYYSPYYTNNDPEAGAIAELNTLRLLADQSNTLEILHKETGKNLFGQAINLNTFLNALRLAKYSEMSFQEYLDREDHYSIIFFYSGFNTDDFSFVSLNIQINNWIIREQGF